MTPKTTAIFLFIALGAAVLFAVSGPGPRRPSEERLSRVETHAKIAPDAETRVEPVPESSSRGPLPLQTLQERIRQQEDRLRQLEQRKKELTDSNESILKQLEKKLDEQVADGSLGRRSLLQEGRDRTSTLKPFLGLSDNQEKAILALWERWEKEDGDRQVDRAVWMMREQEFGGTLLQEQADKLHQHYLSQYGQTWSYVLEDLAGTGGLDANQRKLFEQTAGSPTWPASLLLLEAHGITRETLAEEAMRKGWGALTAEQAEKISKAVEGMRKK